MISLRRLWPWPALLCVSLAALGAPERQVSPEFKAAQQAYDAAKARYQTNPNDNQAAREFAAACFDRADLAGKDSTRAATAREGIEVCRSWLRRAPDQAAAHYYLGMNLGQLARGKKLGAFPLIKEMEKEWLAARELDPHVDFAGPDRNLGLLYRDAPGFPVSIGSRAKAEQHIERAVELDPEYPENHLNLIETHLKHKPAEAAVECRKLLAILPAARKQFTGPQWQSAWQDWDQRLQKLQARLK